MTSRPKGRGGIKDFVTKVLQPLYQKSVMMGEGGVSKIIDNCVTSFMYDPLPIYYS